MIQKQLQHCSVDDHMESMANGVIDFPEFDSPNLGGPVRTDIATPLFEGS